MKHFSKQLTIFIVMGILASLVGCSSTAAPNSANKNNTATTTKKQSAAVKKGNETAQSDQDKAAAPAQNAKTSETQAPTSGEPGQNGTNQSTQTQPTVQPAATSQKANATTSASSGNSTASASASQAAPAKQPTTPTVPQATPAPAQTVTFSIVGPKEDHSADRGASTVKITNGESLLDVLLDAAGKGNVDYSGSGATAYISGINNIYEFDYGAKSGWVFKLNGVSLSKSIGVVSVKNGDRIECLYTE